MKKTYFLTPLYFALVLHSALAQTPKPAPPPAPAAEYNPVNWKQLTSSEGGFTISMPGVPASSTNLVETAVGNIVLHEIIATTTLAAYEISYCDFLVPPNDPSVIKGVMDKIRDRVLSDGTKLLIESDVNLDGNVGRELIFESSGTIGRQRMFFINGRLYVAMLFTTPNVAFKHATASSNLADFTDLYQTTCERFFGSLKLIQPRSAAISADETRAANNGILAPVTSKTDLYPADADARKEIDEALKQAAGDHKRVMLVFGANWCYDCHVLDRALHEGPAGQLMKESFVLVHVDIGEGNKNLDLLKQYKVPLEKGVPAVAILGADGSLLYSSGEGEFEAARRMMKRDLIAFLEKWREN